MKKILLTGLLLGSFGIQASDVVDRELAKNDDLRTERQKIFGIRGSNDDDEESDVFLCVSECVWVT